VIAAIVVFAIQVYLAASWFDWQFGASYGHRAFTDGLGLAALLVAACFEWAVRRAHVRRAVTMVAAVCVALSVVQMLQYWTRSIPEANTSWDQYRESFLRFR
jgi:thiol:disulfide interchange protein